MPGTSDTLAAMYDDYYADGSNEAKREITSVQTLDHIKKLTGGEQFDRIIDIGAGEGSVVGRLSKYGFGKSLAAVEISASGVEAINRRSLPNLESVQAFDGYHIPHPDKSFDLGLAIHVVEHVEHERLFLAEAARIARKLYIEVPLEHTRRMERAIRISGPFGHINFYTPTSFENLLKTSGLSVERMTIFSNNLEYEQFCGGRAMGWMKHKARTGILNIAPKFAVRNFTYMAGALCSSASG